MCVVRLALKLLRSPYIKLYVKAINYAPLGALLRFFYGFLEIK